jgi:hypothetical protein
MVYLGHCSTRLGNYDTALRRYESALSINPLQRNAAEALGTLTSALHPSSHLLDSLKVVLDGTRLGVRDLKGLTPAELRILRNACYARHGLKFNEPTLDNFFYGNLRPSKLPRLQALDTMTDLSKDERSNVTDIQKLERTAAADSVE